jgi:hypothetical protein
MIPVHNNVGIKNINWVGYEFDVTVRKIDNITYSRAGPPPNLYPTPTESMSSCLEIFILSPSHLFTDQN